MDGHRKIFRFLLKIIGDLSVDPKNTDDVAKYTKFYRRVFDVVYVYSRTPWPEMIVINEDISLWGYCKETLLVQSEFIIYAGYFSFNPACQ
jgi:hypothetical protein